MPTILFFLLKFSKPLYVKSGVVGYHEATAQNVLWIIGKNLYTGRREGSRSGLRARRKVSSFCQVKKR